MDKRAYLRMQWLCDNSLGILRALGKPCGHQRGRMPTMQLCPYCNQVADGHTKDSYNNSAHDKCLEKVRRSGMCSYGEPRNESD